MAPELARNAPRAPKRARMGGGGYERNDPIFPSILLDTYSSAWALCVYIMASGEMH